MDKFGHTLKHYVSAFNSSIGNNATILPFLLYQTRDFTSRDSIFTFLSNLLQTTIIIIRPFSEESYIQVDCLKTVHLYLNDEGDIYSVRNRDYISYVNSLINIDSLESILSQYEISVYESYSLIEDKRILLLGGLSHDSMII